MRTLYRLTTITLLLIAMSAAIAEPAPQSALLKAISIGDHKEAFRLLEMLPPEMVNRPIQWSNGDTLLHLAVAKSRARNSVPRMKIIRALIEKGADPNRIDNKGQSPLYMAKGLSGETAKILDLLVESGGNINASDLNGDSPLHVYSASRNVDVVMRAIALGADVNATNKRGSTPIMSGARSASPRVIDALLKSGANLHASDKFRANALHYAAQSGSLDMVEFVIDKGIDINSATGDGKTALSYLAERRKWSAVRFLIEKGADPHVPMHGSPSVAFFLITHPELNMAALIDKSKIQVNAPSSGMSTPPLFDAINRVDMERLELLVELGVDVNMTLAPNYPAIPLIAEKDPNRHKDAIPMLRRLIELGADLEARKMGKGDTGLAVAVKKGHADMVKILLDSGAKIDNLVIYNAVKHRQYATATALLSHPLGLDWDKYLLWKSLQELASEIEGAHTESAVTDQVKLLTGIFESRPRIDLRSPQGNAIDKIRRRLESSTSVVVLNAISQATFIDRKPVPPRSRNSLYTSGTASHISQGRPAPTVSAPKRVYAKNANLHVIGVYEGTAINAGDDQPWWSKCRGLESTREISACHSKYASRHPERKVEIHVASKEKPAILAMMAYEPTHWVIKQDPGVKIEAIILAGYHGQRVSGIDQSTPIDVFTNEHSDCGRCQVGEGYFYGYKPKGSGKALSRLKSLTGHDPASFQGRYTGKAFSVID